jgi:hypothetical protein
MPYVVCGHEYHYQLPKIRRATYSSKVAYIQKFYTIISF